MVTCLVVWSEAECLTQMTLTVCVAVDGVFLLSIIANRHIRINNINPNVSVCNIHDRSLSVSHVMVYAL